MTGDFAALAENYPVFGVNMQYYSRLAMLAFGHAL